MRKDIILGDVFPEKTVCIHSQSVPAYLEGRLTRDDHQAFKAHLDTCTACQHEVEEIQALMALDDAGMEVPDGDAGAILNRLAPTPQQAASGTRMRTWVRGLALAAALSCVAVGIHSLYRHLSTPVEPVFRGSSELTAIWHEGELFVEVPWEPESSVKLRILSQEGKLLWAGTVGPQELMEADVVRLQSGQTGRGIPTEGLTHLQEGARLEMAFDGEQWLIAILSKDTSSKSP